MRWILLFLVLLIPALAFSAEYCSIFDGKCKDVCADNEVAEQGAFMDCTDKQECCVLKKDANKLGISAAPAPYKKKIRKANKARIAPTQIERHW